MPSVTQIGFGKTTEIFTHNSWAVCQNFAAQQRKFNPKYKYEVRNTGAYLTKEKLK